MIETKALQTEPFDWPHAPVHRLSDCGTYIVTAGTYQKQYFFAGNERLDYLTKALLVLALEHGLRLQAWAVFSNHYHLIGETDQPISIVPFIRYLHSVSAKFANRLDETPGRRVWHQYWDTHITHQSSFFARLKYVHFNPVKHGAVSNPELYKWCSAAWFARTAAKSFQLTIREFSLDKVTVPDDYALIV